MSSPLTTTPQPTKLISLDLPPGTSAMGRRSLLRRLRRIYKGLYTGYTPKLSLQQSSSFAAVMSSLPMGHLINVSVTVVKKGTSMNTVLNQSTLSPKEIESVLDGMLHLNLPAHHLLTKSMLSFLFPTMGASLELQLTITLSQLLSPLRLDIGLLDSPEAENPEDAETVSLCSTPSHSTNGGTDTDIRTPSYLMTSITDTLPGSEVSSKSGPTTMDSLLKLKERVSRLDQRDFWSQASTELRTCSPTDNWLKRSNDVLWSSTLNPESPSTG